jgi:hypothetical protein
LRNRAGSFVFPDAAGIAAAVDNARNGGDDLDQLSVDSPGEASYRPLLKG